MALVILLLVAGAALAFTPYSRPLTGSVDGGGRAVVGADCNAPAVAAFQPGSATLSADRTWVGDPPCAYSARFRLGFAAALALGGLVLGVAQGRRDDGDA